MSDQIPTTISPTARPCACLGAPINWLHDMSGYECGRCGARWLHHTRLDLQNGKSESDTAIPITRVNLNSHVVQRIKERMDLSHLWIIEPGPDGLEAYPTEEAAGSIWRVVQDAIKEAGWRVCT